MKRSRTVRFMDSSLVPPPPSAAGLPPRPTPQPLGPGGLAPKPLGPGGLAPKPLGPGGEQNQWDQILTSPYFIGAVVLLLLAAVFAAMVLFRSNSNKIRPAEVQLSTLPLQGGFVDRVMSRLS